MSLYDIIDGRDPRGRLDFKKITDTMEALEVGKAFVIPASDLEPERDGTFFTTTIGQRIHQAAKRRGMQVRTTKLKDEGLRVKRIA